MEIEAFHKQPEEAGHYTILEEDYYSFAANLWTQVTEEQPTGTVIKMNI